MSYTQAKACGYHQNGITTQSPGEGRYSGFILQSIFVLNDSLIFPIMDFGVPEGKTLTKAASDHRGK